MAALVEDVRNEAAQQGLTAMSAPAPIRDELVELGQALAFDKLLSGNQDISCMTCHPPTLATSDRLSLSIGVGGSGVGEERVHPAGTFIPRNAPTLFNLHAMDTLFWDGRVSFHGQIDTPADEHLTQDMIDVFEFGALSAVAMFPVVSRAEMRGALGTNDLSLIPGDDFTSIWEALMMRIAQIPEYVEMFEEAYPGTSFDDMTFAHAANAIAAFEIDSFVAKETPWDEFLRGDDEALSLAQLEGASDFLGDAKCSTCHSGQALTDLAFHNTELAQFGPGENNGLNLDDDWGRFNVTRDAADFYRFRTPPLRNVALSGPWGHAGQFDDLSRFVGHYVDPTASLQNYDPIAEGVVPELAATLQYNTDAILRHTSSILHAADFDADRVDEMVEFMHALTDPDSIDLLHTIPEAVPSGLPVADDDLVVPENYAGSVEVTWNLPGSGFHEYQLQRPEMCDGGGTATVSFDRNANTLTLDSEIHGLPYKPDACYEYDPSTPFNEYPACVEDGVWQIWFLGRLFNLLVPFWYDAFTGDLIGADWELEYPPLNAFSVTLPVTQLIGSPTFESDPETLIANVHFEWEYDQILDDRGTAGAVAAILPVNIYNPTEVVVYYTTGGVPAEHAMSWDDIIEVNAEGLGAFALALSLEPDPKPENLLSIDNLMIAWSASFPALAPEFQNIPEEPCGTDFQWDGVNLDPPPLP